MNPVDSPRLGTVAIATTDPVWAGGFGSWTVTITVGHHGIDDGGTVALCRRDVSDWEIPQFDRPRESGYVTVETTGRAKLRLVYDQALYIRPYRAAIAVQVYDGTLAAGDTVRIYLGDTREGSPGMRAQTFRESKFSFKVVVDAFGTGRYYEMGHTPGLAIIGGPAEQVQLVAPSTLGVGEEFDLLVRVLDTWGNPSSMYSDRVRIDGEGFEGLPAEVTFAPGEPAARRIGGLRATKVGRARLTAADSGGLEAQSNPIEVQEGIPDRKLYWGDLHGQTGHTVGTGGIDEYLEFARNVAGLDFTSWQGNDFQITAPDWREIVDNIERYHEPGRFIPFLGYEWSGLTTAGGDHNFYFLNDDEPLHRSSHWLIDDKRDEETDRYPLDRALAQWKDRKDVLAVPHVGGRYANLDYHDERFMPVVEIHSHHGTFEWMAAEAIKRGLIVGFIAGSDDHTCRPGLSYPTLAASRGLASFDVKGGLVGISSPELTREAIWEEIFKRHTYGTTGERMYLRVETDSGEVMGDVVAGPKAPMLNVDIGATAPLFSVEVMRGLETVHRWPDLASLKDAPLDEKRLAVVWRGVRVKSRKKKANWDGNLVVQGGSFRHAEPFAFDRRDEGMTRLSTQHIAWRSTTSGDPDGLLIDINGDPSTTLRFTSGPASFDVSLGDVEDRMVRFDGGGANFEVQVFWVPTSPGPLDMRLSYQDPNPVSGEVNPYWIRVTQADGAMAWSSPIYFKCK